MNSIAVDGVSLTVEEVEAVARPRGPSRPAATTPESTTGSRALPRPQPGPMGRGMPIYAGHHRAGRLRGPAHRARPAPRGCRAI